MEPKALKENYGKVLLIGGSVLMWLLILVLFQTTGYERTWQLWKVPTQRLPFMDFRLIPGSAESFANGFEPSVENPHDPNGRIFNYPAFWRLFFYTGINQADTLWISVAMIILFFMGALLFPQKLSISGAVGMLAVLFSPASMLLYERGNVDLIVFFICTMILLAADISLTLAAFLILLGGVMKLFPIVGLSIFLRESKRKFFRVSAACVLVLLAYMLLTWDSVRASWTLTMRGDGLSYGTNILTTRYETAISRVLSTWLPASQIEFLLNYGLLAAALVLLFLVFILGIRDQTNPVTLTERNFAAFRMGASIYVGTFLLGHNWDYRLAFLVLIVPQLVEWMGFQNRTYRRAAWLSMVLVLLSCWHLWMTQIPLVPVFNSVADSNRFWIILDEVFNRMLIASHTYLLFVSAPEWLEEPFRNILQKGKSDSQYDQEQSHLPIS
jgi:hypothetical protein